MTSLSHTHKALYGASEPFKKEEANPLCSTGRGRKPFPWPQRVKAREGVRGCSKYGPLAIQDVAASSFGKWTAGYLDVNKTVENGLISEDRLNLWTKAAEGERLPVIVYIHGSGHFSASTPARSIPGKTWHR